MRQELESIRAELRSVQNNIENVAHAGENVPAMQLLTEEAAPRAVQLHRAVTALIDEEVTLEATPERKQLLGHFADMRGSMGMALASISSLRSATCSTRLVICCASHGLVGAHPRL
jgi:methyl-accepting chemotaxis protein